jgi:hypothetical protein
VVAAFGEYEPLAPASDSAPEAALTQNGAHS